MAAAPVGIIANPASGKDIRRLIAHAPVSTDVEKRAILRRFLIGAAAGGAADVLYLAGPHRLVEDALAGLDLPLRALPLPLDLTDSALDTRNAAAACRAAGAAVVLVLGGDGTCRAAAAGWQDIPILPLSTGTNNVFPLTCEPTVAGLAAGLVAAGRLTLAEVATPAPVIEVEVEGEPPDLALVDAALVDDLFSGARAVWRPAELRAVLLLRADPAVTGLAAIGGMLGLPRPADGALHLELGEGGTRAHVPLAPGLVLPVPVRAHDRLPFDRSLAWHGPGIVALDGERDRRLLPGQRAALTPRRTGPRVIDPRRALERAAAAGLFIEVPCGARYAD